MLRGRRIHFFAWHIPVAATLGEALKVYAEAMPDKPESAASDPLRLVLTVRLGKPPGVSGNIRLKTPLSPPRGQGGLDLAQVVSKIEAEVRLEGDVKPRSFAQHWYCQLMRNPPNV
jgi:hypothetical protein